MTIENGGDKSQSPEKLRKLAIEELKLNRPPPTEDLIHELQVNQFELEVQNEELKHSQIDLELSREKYFNLFDIAPVGYCSISSSGLIEEITLKACELFGLDRTYLKKQLFSSFVFKDDLHIYYQTVKNISKTGDSQTCELRLIRRNGDMLWVLLDISSAQNADGLIFYLIAVSDITGRKEIESVLGTARTELAKSKISEDAALEYSESIINTIREPLIILDHDLRVVSASRSFYEFFKVKREETQGQLIYELGNNQWDIPELRNLLETILPEKTTFNNYEVSHDFDYIGRRVMLLNARQIQRQSGQERIILLAIEDISDRKKSEEKFSKAFQVNPSACGFSDLTTGQYIEVNEAFYSLFGFEENEVIGKNAVELGILTADTLKDLTLTIGKSETIVNLETNLKTKNGDIKHVLLSADDVYLQEKKCRFTVVHDITEQHRAKEQLRESEERYRIISEQLIERVKELNCLYSISAIIELPDISLDEILQKIADIIPSGYKYPERTCARITIGGKEYKTNNFKETKLGQSSNVMAYKIKIGYVEVFYLKERHETIGSIFLKEGQDLLIAITERLNRVIERKKAEEALTMSNRRLEMANAAGGVGIWVLDLITSNLVWDDQMFALYGITPGQFTNVYEAWISGLHPEDKVRGDTEVQMAIRGEKEFDTVFRVVWPDGTIHHISARAQVRRDNAGKPLEIIGTNYDSTYQKNREKEILNLSYHDVLTGLYNRRFFEEEIKRLDTERQIPLSIIIGDLNNLKLTNDTFGHLEGDRLLIETAKLLEKVCRSDDILARWGGDEFVILLPTASIRAAEEVVQRIKKGCSELFIQNIPIGLAIGIAAKTEHEQI